MTAVNGELVTGAAPPSSKEKMAAAATASVDLVSRTGVASLVALTAAPALLRGDRAEERDQIDFYAGVAATGDPERAFVAPPSGVPVRSRPMQPPPWLRGVGPIDLLSFESPYEALYPGLGARYARHRRNRTAWAQRWRHSDRPRPTIVVAHGFMASSTVFNSAFFSLPRLYGQGYDVVLVTLPFHGRRACGPFIYSGSGLFAHGFAHINEAILQGVSDVRVLIGYLLEGGAEAVGLTGYSLGGYTVAGVASVDSRPHFVIPNAALSEASAIMRIWFPASRLVAHWLRRHELGFDDLRRALAVHSPLTYPPAVPRERRFVICGLGDRLAPPAQTKALWEHWERCRLHWHPGSHVVHVRRSAYLREIDRFLRTIGFDDGLPPE